MSPPPHAAPASASSSGKTRRTWLLRGRIQKYLVVRSFELEPEEADSRVSSIYPLAELDRWLDSPLTRGLLHEMGEAIEGSRTSHLVLSAAVSRGQLRECLARALREGLLVALPVGPLLLRKTTASVKARAVRPSVPLLPDEPGPRPAKPSPVPPPAPRPAVNAAAQARVLREAARAGTPLCEECEKPSRPSSSSAA